MAAARRATNPGCVWLSSNGVEWEIVGETTVGKRRLLMFRRGQDPPPHGWRPLIRTAEQLRAGWRFLPEERGRDAVARSVAIQDYLDVVC